MTKDGKAAMAEANDSKKKVEIQDEQMEGVVGGTVTERYMGVTYTCDAEGSTKEMFDTFSNPNFWSNGTCPFYIYDNEHVRPAGVTSCSSCTHYDTEKNLRG